MFSKILFNDEAMDAVKSGFDKVVNQAKITMGPRGGNVMIDQGAGHMPIIANDAKTICDSSIFEDRFEDMGASVCKDIISKMEDGRSSALSIGQKMLDAGLAQKKNGHNPMMLRRGIESATADMIQALSEVSKPISTDEEIRQVARVSSESVDVGNIVGDVIKKIGNDGIVSVEESQSLGIESEIVEGTQIDRGYISPYMITDVDRMEAVCTDVPVLITDKAISNPAEIMPIMQKVAKAGHTQMLIIAEDVTGDALKMMILSKLSPGGLGVLAIKAPGFGEHKKELLGDIAVLIGTTVVSDSLGMKLEDLNLAGLGTVRRVVATKETTTLIDGKGDKEDIAERVEQLKKQKDSLSGNFEKETIEGRIANLVGGIAVIKVGAATETEMKYMKLKIEDAVKATKGAIKYGVVQGGGVSFIRAKKLLEAKQLDSDSAEFVAGYKIVLDALEAPLRQILENAGHDAETIDGIVKKIYESPNAGFDAEKNEIVMDMLQSGIIDSVKVTQNAIVYSASAVGIFLTNGAANARFKAE